MSTPPQTLLADKLPTVIVGAGASGTLFALAASRLSPESEVILCEGSREPGQGIAYSTKDEAHRLNVPARSMSAYADEPGDFMSWARKRMPGLSGNEFLPRRVYGTYLGSRLEAAERSGGRLSVRREQVTAVRSAMGGATVTFESGEELAAAQVVLAVGGPPTADRATIPQDARDDGTYVGDPWARPEWLENLDGVSDVILIGSGLTMIDAALSINARRPRARMVSISRSGLLPRTHRPGQPAPMVEFPIPDRPASLDELAAIFLRQLGVAASRGGDATDVVDSLRPSTQRLWQSLSGADRRIFVRDLRRVWDIHRHRMAPEVGGTISQLREDGLLEIRSGAVRAMQHLPGRGIGLEFFDEHGQRTWLEAERAINCCGPKDDVGGEAMPLIQQLLDDGIAVPDDLGLGLAVSREGSLLDAAGRVSERIHVIGPLRKGTEWETIAVPELRQQAFALANHLHAGTAELAVVA